MTTPPRKTYPDLGTEADVVGTDLIATYRSPGPLKTVTGDVLSTFIQGSLGTMAVQDADAVAITGGTISGVSSLGVTGGTVTASAPLITGTQTWNNAAVTFTGYKLNVTNTASATTSKMLDLQIGGTSKFTVDYLGVPRIGSYGSSSTDSGCVISRDMNDASTTSGHGFVEASYFRRGGTSAFAAFDATTVLAANIYDHWCGFQDRGAFQAATVGQVMTDMFGLHSRPAIDAGAVTNRYGVYIAEPVITGGATIGTHYGLYVAPLSAGTTKWGVYVSDAPSYFGSSVRAASIELGAATDTTISRVSAGVIAVEGNTVLVNGGALGTPSSATLTNATGLPISTGVSGLGTGVATFLATPSSANLAAALTTKTGTGLNVFDTAPTLAGPITTGQVSSALGSAAAPAYSFTGDLDVGMWSPAANTLAFSTSGTEAIRVFSTRNVSIGNTTDTDKLSVTGDIRASNRYYGQGTSAYVKLDDGNGAQLVYGTSNLTIGGPMILYSSGVEYFRVNAGTGDITTKGFVQAYSTTAIPAGGSAGKGLMVSSTSNFGVFFGSGAPTLSAAKGSLYMRSDGSATNNRMYVNTDGSTTWTAVTTAA